MNFLDIKAGDNIEVGTAMSEEKTNVVVHPVTARKVSRDVCPKCGGELDTGWECNDCGFDAIGFVELDPLGREK